MVFNVLTLQSPKANITVNNAHIVAAHCNSFQRGMTRAEKARARARAIRGVTTERDDKERSGDAPCDFSNEENGWGEGEGGG